MKLSELRQLIREEIVTVINEVTVSASDKANKGCGEVILY